MDNKQFYSTLNDIVGPSHKYPNAIRKIIYEKKHIRNQDRFTVTCFFLANGLNPQVFGPWMMRRYKLDKAAGRQINWIINKYPTSKWKAWNVAHNKSV